RRWLAGNVAVPHQTREVDAEVDSRGVSIEPGGTDDEAHHFVGVREHFDGNQLAVQARAPVTIDVCPEAGRALEGGNVIVWAAVGRGDRHDAVRRVTRQHDDRERAQRVVGTHHHGEGGLRLRGRRVLDGD